MFELKKIGIIKRVSAWLLDAILLAVLTTGFMYIISLICHYQDAYNIFRGEYTQWEAFRTDHIPSLAQEYGFTYEIDDRGEYSVDKDGRKKDVADIVSAMLEDVSASHGFSYTQIESDDPNIPGYSLKKADGEVATLNDVVETFPEEGLSPMEEVFKAYAALPTDLNARYLYMISMLFMMLSVGLVLSFLILEFIVPLCLKNGQTIGKKVFSICLVRPPCVKVSAVALFGRTIIGKFAIEMMFPILLVFMMILGMLGTLIAIILIAALLIFNIILFFATKNHTPIHDILAVTAAADMKEQMIFASEEELNEKKAEAKRQAALLDKENG